MIPLLLTTLCFTVLYSGHQAQAQMQTKTMTTSPSASSSENNANPPLFVTPQKQKPSAEQKEIDRVFEKYKLLSAEQDAQRNAKPMKNNPAKPKRPSRPTIPQKEKAQKAPPSGGGGFAAILDSYERAKSGRSTVQSKSVTKPEEIKTND